MVKHRHIQDAIVEGIRSGEFPPDSRLPSERELALRFDVSYLTARHAVAQLVVADLLERRSRSGTYVRSHSRRRLAMRTYYLICTPDDHSQARAYLRVSSRLIDERGGRPQTIRLYEDAVHSALRALQSGDPVLIMADGFIAGDPLAVAMLRAEGRAVLVGTQVADLAVPTVTTDDGHALRFAIDHLQAKGHRRIALLCDDPDNPIAQRQIDAWRTYCAAKPADEHLIAVRTASYACLRTTAYDVFRAFLRSDAAKAVTAAIVLVDEMVAPVLTACRDEARSVPDGLSLIALGGDNALFDYAQPPVTSVDVDIEGHVMQALSIIDAAESGTLRDDDRLRLIEPRLIERQSVAAV